MDCSNRSRLELIRTVRMCLIQLNSYNPARSVDFEYDDAAFASFISSGGFQFCLIFSRTLSRYQEYLKSCCDVTATPSLCFPVAGDTAAGAAGAEGTAGDSLGTASFAFVFAIGAGFCFRWPKPGNASFFGADFLSSTAAFFDVGAGFAAAGITSFFGIGAAGAGRS